MKLGHQQLFSLLINLQIVWFAYKHQKAVNNAQRSLPKSVWRDWFTAW